MRPLWQYKAWPFLIGKDINQTLVRRFSYAPDKKVCFVAGAQRSGTNMIMNVIERHPDTYVFKESDPRAFDGFMMRAISQIENLVDRTIPSIVVVKALHEAHDLYWMLDHFEGSKLVWMFRDYVDVINSNQRRFNDTRNYIDEIVKDPRRGFWRGLGMTDETLAIVREHYSEDLDNNSAQALFWYYRNQLFFYQNFDEDSRVLLIKYEPFVSEPLNYLDSIVRFVGLEADPNLVKTVHRSSIRKNEPPEIAANIVALCDGMRDRLDTVFRAKFEQFQ